MGLDRPDSAPKLGDLVYRIIIECVDEDHQKELLEEFEAEDIVCRALVS